MAKKVVINKDDCFGCGNLADSGQLRRASVGFDRLFGNKI